MELIEGRVLIPKAKVGDAKLVIMFLLCPNDAP